MHCFAILSVLAGKTIQDPQTLNGSCLGLSLSHPVISMSLASESRFLYRSPMLISLCLSVCHTQSLELWLALGR